ncbi:MAG TPA: hypothetical protein VJ953_21815 [Saprospiraceae bacterium]|nr:hypothetical protein [Saprospiraceae bacterium]
MNKLVQLSIIAGLVILLTGNPSYIESWLNLDYDLGKFFSIVWLFSILLILEFFKEWKKENDQFNHGDHIPKNLSKKGKILFGMITLVIGIMVFNPFLIDKFNLNILNLLKPVMLLAIVVWGAADFFKSDSNPETS